MITTVFAVFAIGLAVTLVVTKGILQANDFATRELEKLDEAALKKSKEFSEDGASKI